MNSIVPLMPPTARRRQTVAAPATFLFFAMASSASATFSLVVCTTSDFAAARFWGGRGGALLCRRCQGMGQRAWPGYQHSTPSSHQPSRRQGPALVALAGCPTHWRSGVPTRPPSPCKVDRPQCSVRIRGAAPSPCSCHNLQVPHLCLGSALLSVLGCRLHILFGLLALVGCTLLRLVS